MLIWYCIIGRRCDERSLWRHIEAFSDNTSSEMAENAGCNLAGKPYLMKPRAIRSKYINGFIDFFTDKSLPSAKGGFLAKRKLSPSMR